MKTKTDTKRLTSKNKVENNKRVRLEGVVRHQADQLKIKNGQLKKGAVRQVRLDEQTRIHMQAMESTADGIFIIDAQKKEYPVIYVNQSFQRMTGFQKNEILGQSFLLFYGADADPRIVNEIKLTIRKGRSFHGEMLNFKKNGKKYWNSLRIAPVRNSGGTITHYIGIQTDVTLMREKEMEIDEQREELLHVTRVGKLAEFVSSLAHEISQPLTAILSCAQAALRMLGGRDPELSKILSYIVNDDQRASAVIQRLRALLKKSAPEIKPLDINTLINETVVLIATDAAVKNVVLKLELATGLPYVRGDKIQLQQVLLNLISNSFDALEESPDPRQIAIHTSRSDAQTIMVAVKDTGSGIPAHALPKLFTHFFTSKPDGLGMGLSISRSIVESHGGRMNAENNPVSGATFYFTIPLDHKDIQ